MKLKVSIDVPGSPGDVWAVISDIRGSVDVVTGIEEIEILNEPPSGLVDLKWRETRTFFGKKATEVMWITESVENRFYTTRAESHGAIYTSRIQLEATGNTTTLSFEFSGEAQTLGAKIASFIFAPMMNGSMRKALKQDLHDISKEVVRRNAADD